MDDQAIGRYKGSIATKLDATDNDRLLSLSTALFLSFDPGTEALHMVRNFPGWRGFGMEALGTTLNGTVLI